MGEVSGGVLVGCRIALDCTVLGLDDGVAQGGIGQWQVVEQARVLRHEVGSSKGEPHLATSNCGGGTTGASGG